jgi:hypothetical protein
MRHLLLAAVAVAGLLAACTEPEPEPAGVLVEAVPFAARNCGPEPGPNEPPPPEARMVFELSVDPPARLDAPEDICHGDRDVITCARQLSATSTIFTHTDLSNGTVRLRYSTPGRCELDYKIERLTWFELPVDQG